jgi:predicted short-subunit dehydrogenase-like oxidoreductase (DUF2520 family)
MQTPTYGLIGRGRLAAHLARYLELEGLGHVDWHRGLVCGAHESLGDADVILLAISDDAVAGFPTAHPELRDRPMVHFSGSLAAAGIHGCHPLTTFGPDLYDLETYREIPFVVDRGDVGFSDLFPGLRNPSWTIDPALKPLYHALCVLAGNFTTILWAKAMEDFESRLGLPREILRPYLRQTVDNCLDRGRGALTGPLARRESGTIERDLDGLRNDPFSEVYLAVARAVGTSEVRS